MKSNNFERIKDSLEKITRRAVGVAGIVAATSGAMAQEKSDSTFLVENNKIENIKLNKPIVHRFDKSVDNPIINLDSLERKNAFLGFFQIYIFRGEPGIPGSKISSIDEHITESSPYIRVESFEFEDTDDVNFREFNLIIGGEEKHLKAIPPKVFLFIRKENVALLEGIPRLFEVSDGCYSLVSASSVSDFYNQINKIISFVNDKLNDKFK